MAFEIFQEMIGSEMDLVIIVLAVSRLATKRDIIADRGQIFHFRIFD